MVLLVYEISKKINGMIRSPNDGVHLETPQAQTTEAWWPTGSKTSSKTPSPRHERVANLAHGIRLVAALYAAQHPHLPQFPRDPGVCDYTPSTGAPAT